MGPDGAIEAIKMINPKIVIPMHYNTFDMIKQDASLFKKMAEERTNSKVQLMEIEKGKEFDFK